MLIQKIYIYDPNSIGGGKYTAALYFSVSTVPQYVNLGDYIRDLDNNEYEIIDPTPMPLTDGATVTLQYITEDISPREDVGYDSIIYTPNQVDVRPSLQTSGALSNPSIYSARDYEYNILAGWNNSTEAAKASIGDRIVDSLGKEFVLTYIDPVDRFNAFCRIQEVEKEMQSPAMGEATLYSPTPNYNYFQGTEMEDPPRNIIQNRDRFIFDLQIKDLYDSIGSGGDSKKIEFELFNDSGSSINSLVPVRSINGSMATIDVSIESQIKAISGITKELVPDEEEGVVVNQGLITNVTTSFDFDDILYIAKDGTLTNIEPEIGVGGFVENDWAVGIGMIQKDHNNPSHKNFLVFIQIIGQL